MNIFALIKRTFDTEEKIVVSGGKIQEDGAEFIINLMTNMPLKRQSKFVTLLVVK